MDTPNTRNDIKSKSFSDSETVMQYIKRKIHYYNLNLKKKKEIIEARVSRLAYHSRELRPYFWQQTGKSLVISSPF